jgi:hypothetical protein
MTIPRMTTIEIRRSSLENAREPGEAAGVAGVLTR